MNAMHVDEVSAKSARQSRGRSKPVVIVSSPLCRDWDGKASKQANAILLRFLLHVMNCVIWTFCRHSDNLHASRAGREATLDVVFLLIDLSLF